MSIALGRRIRWIAAAACVVAWFAALALDVGGNGVHLLLVGAIALLGYELLVVDAPA